MTYRIALLVTISLITFMFISCSDNPASIGSDLLGKDYIEIKKMDSLTDTLMQSSSYFQKAIPLGGAENLLLGKKDNVESSVLIKFYFANLADSIKSDLISGAAKISSSSVSFTKNYTYGDSTAAFNFSVHKVNSDWSSTDFTGSDLSTLLYDGADISSNKNFTDTTYSFDIDGALVNSWLVSAATSDTLSDNGIYLKPSAGTNKVVGFQALSAVLTAPVPKLRAILVKPGVYTDTLYFTPAADLSAATGSLPKVSPDEIVVQAGLVINSKISFDLSKIPQNAIINHADLILTIDTLSTITGTNYINSLTVSPIIDSTNLDSTNFQVAIKRNGSTFSGDITSIVSRWILNQNNMGMIIKATGEDSGFEMFVLKGSNAISPADRPRLKLIYTNKK